MTAWGVASWLLIVQGCIKETLSTKILVCCSRNPLFAGGPAPASHPQAPQQRSVAAAPSGGSRVAGQPLLAQALRHRLVRQLRQCLLREGQQMQQQQQQQQQQQLLLLPMRRRCWTLPCLQQQRA